MDIRYRDTGPAHELIAVADGAAVGQLTWRKRTRVVDIVWVHPDYRRRGIGTALWQHAATLDVPSPRHSTNRTPAGIAWSASLSA